MPLYTMKHTETGEEKEFFLSFSELDKHIVEHPEWELQLSTALLVSQVGSNLAKTDDGWKEMLKRIKKGSGKSNTINT